MKTLFNLFLLLLSHYTFSQGFIISQYENCDTGAEYRRLIGLFQDQDKKPTILKLNSRHYLTFEGDMVYRYDVAESENLILYKKQLSQEEAYQCRQLLDTLKTVKPSLLNSTGNEKGEKIIVEDGVTFKIELFKENCMVAYSSHSPSAYIENGYPNREERKKFVAVYDGIRSFFDDEEYENLKRKDTIYLLYDKTSKTRNLKYAKIASKKVLRYSFLFSDKKDLILKTFAEEKRAVEKKSIDDKEIINLGTIDRYRFDLMFELFYSKKVIYIIDEEDNKQMKNKAVLRRAYLSYNQ